MNRSVLLVEDEPEAAESTVETVESVDLHVVAARSTDEARRALATAGFAIAFLDQRLPRNDKGEWASDAEVLTLARDIAVSTPIVWLSAHEVPEERMAIPNCLGRVQKSGDVTAEVLAHLQEVIPTIFAPSLDNAMDELMVVLKNETDGGAFSVRVPTWRPEEHFSLRAKHLPAWVADAVLAAEGREVRFRARGRLGAVRAAQLDLSDWHLVPRTAPVDASFWDV